MPAAPSVRGVKQTGRWGLDGGSGEAPGSLVQRSETVATGSERPTVELKLC
jgi:hypothetical protein